MILYVINSALWSVLGFVAGYVASRTRRDVTEIKEAVVDGDVDVDADDYQGPDRRKPTRTPLPQRRLGLFLIVLALLTVGQAVYFDIRERTFSHCQARINQDQTLRTRALTAVQDQERNTSRRADDALAAIVNASLRKPPASEAEARRLVVELQSALVAQNRARAEADKARAANPPPPEADETCS